MVWFVIVYSATHVRTLNSSHWSQPLTPQRATWGERRRKRLSLSLYHNSLLRRFACGRASRSHARRRPLSVDNTPTPHNPNEKNPHKNPQQTSHILFGLPTRGRPGVHTCVRLMTTRLSIRGLPAEQAWRSSKVGTRTSQGNQGDARRLGDGRAQNLPRRRHCKHNTGTHCTIYEVVAWFDLVVEPTNVF